MKFYIICGNTVCGSFFSADAFVYTNRHQPRYATSSTTSSDARGAIRRRCTTITAAVRHTTTAVPAVDAATDCLIVIQPSAVALPTLFIFYSIFLARLVYVFFVSSCRTRHDRLPENVSSLCNAVTTIVFFFFFCPFSRAVLPNTQTRCVPHIQRARARVYVSRYRKG